MSPTGEGWKGRDNAGLSLVEESVGIWGLERIYEEGTVDWSCSWGMRREGPGTWMVMQ